LQHKSYIEGLRGIAVLSVIFFHLNHNFFHGGYLGVDIFFVLSGFLITQSISNRIDNENFHFIEYYKKRFFRIAPTALIVILITATLGYILFFPEELINLYTHIYSILTITSNVLASKTIDYFGIGVNYQPLVHYWSLSIEIQFYIIFPLVVFLFIKYNHKRILLLIQLLFTFLSITIISLYSDLTTHEQYFSTYMRLWEFSIGSIAFLILDIYGNKINNKHFYNKSFPYIGLFLLLLSLIIFDKTYNVPGINTIYPTIGVFLLLVFTKDTSGMAKILSIYPLQVVGIISYSLYLVHQPIFVLYRTIMGRDFSFMESMLLLLFTFVIAILLYKVIEKPFQKRNRKKNFFILIIVLFSIGLLVVSNKNMNKNIRDYVVEERVQKYLSFRYDNNPRIKECRISNKIIMPNKSCTYGEKGNKIKIVLWGDSHIDQIVTPLSKELNKFGYRTIEFSIAGCPPIIGVDVQNKRRKCYQNSKTILNHILSKKEYTDIILFAYWTNYINNNDITIKETTLGDDKIIIALRKTINILQNNGKRVHIIYPVPRMKVNPPFYMARLEKLWLSKNYVIKISEKEYALESSRAIKLLDSSMEKLNVNKIYISELLKKNNYYLANNKEIIYYRDDNHLSSSGGGELVSEKLTKKIMGFIKENKE